MHFCARLLARQTGLSTCEGALTVHPFGSRQILLLVFLIEKKRFFFFFEGEKKEGRVDRPSYSQQGRRGVLVVGSGRILGRIKKVSVRRSVDPSSFS